MKRLHALLSPQTGSFGLRGIALTLGLLLGLFLLPLIGEEPAGDTPVTPSPKSSDPAVPDCVCPVLKPLEAAQDDGPDAAEPPPTAEPGETTVTDTNAVPEKIPPFISLNGKKDTVDFYLVATFNAANYGMNFNGYAKGNATYTVPTGWTVNVTFRNNSPVPHSVLVVEEDMIRKLQFKEPYFEGAATPKFITGTTGDVVDNFQFVADEAGDYAFACGFPAHSANGHWIKFEVSDEIKIPTWTAGDNEPVEAASPSDSGSSKLYNGDPLRVLVVTGGCCHNYDFQTEAMTNGVNAQVDVDWTIEHKGGKGTAYQSELYEDPDWAKDYDVVVHNECFAKTSDAAYIKKVVAGHATNGTPAVVVHCAMHTYRDAKGGDWQNFLGVTSYKHEHQSEYAVTVVKPGHPTMEGFPTDWVTPKDELYIVDKVWPGAEVLATSKSEKSGKEHPVIWANTHEGTRVFGTTYGHSDATFRDPVFLDLLAQGLVWAAGKDADSSAE